jgi:osmoprotectant transport system ATP-binding protein
VDKPMNAATATNAMIEFQQVGKSFDGQAVVEDFSLAIAPGEFVVLIGRSGSGKSTTLKMVNRLVEHDRGRILFAGQEIRSFRPEDLRRRMGYAIQSTGLFPHWTVERNIACVPELLKWPAARIRDRVTELLALLQLPPDLYRGRYPHQLSGGQQQRVGVARALAADPDVLLMDEPFGALDPITREALQLEMARIHRLSGKTVVLVTHDIDEALRLGTRIVLLDHGRIVQAGTPRHLLTEPANDFVRDFIGRGDIGLRLLALDMVASRMRPAGAIDSAVLPLRDTDTLREALSALVAAGAQHLPVVDADGTPCGQIHLADLVPVRAQGQGAA